MCQIAIRNAGMKQDDIARVLNVFVCLFLLLYVPCQQLWSLRDGQFTKPHFSWAGLSKRLTSNLCTYFRL